MTSPAADIYASISEGVIYLLMWGIPTNKHCPNVGWMLVHRLQRWSNIKPTEVKHTLKVLELNRSPIVTASYATYTAHSTL